MTDPVDTAGATFATRTPHPALRDLVSGYHGYRYQVEAPGVHHGLPSTALIVVLAFDRPLDVGWWGEEHSRGRHWALASGLSVSPAAIYQDGHPARHLVRPDPARRTGVCSACPPRACAGSSSRSAR